MPLYEILTFITNIDLSPDTLLSVVTLALKEIRQMAKHDNLEKNDTHIQ